jgi:hypothetical protein
VVRSSAASDVYKRQEFAGWHRIGRRVGEGSPIRRGLRRTASKWSTVDVELVGEGSPIRRGLRQFLIQFEASQRLDLVGEGSPIRRGLRRTGLVDGGGKLEAVGEGSPIRRGLRQTETEI